MLVCCRSDFGTMKRFLSKIAIVSIPFILLLFFLNYNLSKSYWWNSISTEQEKFKNVPTGIQLANIGSSLGNAGFDYKDFSEYTTFNFALNWQHNIYNYYVFKQYADNFSKKSVLLIPISYFDITRIEKEPNTRYYTFLDKENIPDFNYKEYILYNYLPLFSIKNVWKIYVNRNNERYWFPLTNHTRDDFIHQSEMYFNWWMRNDPDVEKGEEGFQYNIEAVSKIINLCYKNDIVPVLVSTPIMDCLNEKYAQVDFFDTFYNFIDVLKEKYPGLLYLDYSQDKGFSNDYWLCFIDPAHLTTFGAKKFTKQVVQDLKDVGLLQ